MQALTGLHGFGCRQAVEFSAHVGHAARDHHAAGPNAGAGANTSVLCVDYAQHS